MEQTLEMPILSKVQVHILNPTGLETITWFVGRDVSKEKLEKFRDVITGDLYAMSYYKNGELLTDLMNKDLWEYTAMQTGVSTGITNEEAQKIKTRVEAFILSRREKLPRLFNDE